MSPASPFRLTLILLTALALGAPPLAGFPGSKQATGSAQRLRRVQDNAHTEERPRAPGSPSPAAALAEGNRLFRSGDLEEALEAYAAGYDGSDPLLAYNLGATSHHLGRLPEALLWYRRAEASAGADPWLRDNLALVREQLGAPSRSTTSTPGSPSGWDLWLENRHRIVLAGAVLAWVVLALLLAPLPPRVPPGVRHGLTAAAALLSCIAFLSGMLLLLRGPRAAVLLRDCAGSGEESLPAGSEVWVLPSPEGDWRVLGRGGLRCRGDAVGLVDGQATGGAERVRN